MSEARTYGDRRPYVAPGRLADLTGPATGRVELPAAIGWTGRRCYDLSDLADARVFYERVLVDALDPGIMTSVLNAQRLGELWPDLFLPHQVRDLWQSRFPELVAAA